MSAPSITLGLLLGLCGSVVLAGEAPTPKHTPKPDASKVYSGRLPLLQFDKSFDWKRVKSNGGTGEAGGTPERPTLRVKTPAGGYPGVLVTAPLADGAWDLSAYQYISVDLHNIDKHDIDVFVRVDNPGANGLQNCVTERTGLQPDQRVTLTIPIKRTSNSAIKLFGMQGYPQGLYPQKAGLDPANIVSLVFFTAKTPTENVFEVANAYAAGKYENPAWLEMAPQQFFPFVDGFGQFMHKDWPGKISSQQQLQEAREKEAAKLSADKGPADWDKWGGWANGPQLEATGHFRVTKHEGKWWLVDPDGRLFFSTGICAITTGWAATPIEDRSGWFAELPANDEAHKAFFGKTWKSWSGYYAGREPVTFDFSSQNLQRKYGENWREVYPDVVHRRLRTWGINTFGNWSNSKWCKMQRTPYTMTFFYTTRKLKQTGAGFPDPFDPGFAKAVAAGARQFLAGTFDDPWCIGYFADNEMPWGGETTLAQDTLKTPAAQPAKQEMLRWLQSRYAGIDALNAAWATKLASWDEFAGSTQLAPKTDAAAKDLTEFTDRIADAYFRTMHDVLRAVAPRKLYLGCRCVGGSTNVIASAIKHCDVVSYNRYCHTVRDVKFPGDLDGPMMLGEFHFGASDRGLFSNGLVSADSQSDRARKYADYINSALDNPQLVGAHWFQYGDQAVTGRGDGENAQCGFVDVCDTPYEETIQAARATAEAMYARRAR